MTKLTLSIESPEKASILLKLLKHLDFVEILDIDKELDDIDIQKDTTQKAKISAIKLQYFLTEMTQERVPVDSSMLTWVAYNDEEEVLTVEFVNSGEIRAYYEVPRKIYEQVLKAPSVGRFMRANVLGTYPEVSLG